MRTKPPAMTSYRTRSCDVIWDTELWRHCNACAGTVRTRPTPTVYPEEKDVITSKTWRVSRGPETEAANAQIRSALPLHVSVAHWHWTTSHCLTYETLRTNQRFLFNSEFRTSYWLAAVESPSTVALIKIHVREYCNQFCKWVTRC